MFTLRNNLSAQRVASVQPRTVVSYLMHIAARKGLGK